MTIHKRLFWFLVFLAPVQLAKHFWPPSAFLLGIRVDYLSPTVYLTDILFLGILVFWIWEKRKQFTTNSLQSLLVKRWYFFVIFLYLFSTSLLAKNPGVALYKFGKIVELVTLGFYVASNFYTSTSLRRLLFPLSLALFYESFIALFQFFKQGSLGSVFWLLGERTFTAGTPGIALMDISGQVFLRPYGTFPHPNALAGFFLTSLLLVWGRSTNLPVWWKILVTALVLPVLLLSFSRVVWLVGLIALLFFLGYRLLFWKQRVKAVFYLFFILTLGLFTVASLFLPRIEDRTTQERLKLFEAANTMIKTSPFVGLGLNNFLVRLPQFWQEGGLYFFQPVHNLFYLVVVETGLVGFIIFVYFLYLTLKKILVGKKYSLAFALFAVVATGLFDHYWFTLQQNELLLTFVCGLIWAHRSGKIS